MKPTVIQSLGLTNEQLLLVGMTTVGLGAVSISKSVPGFTKSAIKMGQTLLSLISRPPIKSIQIGDAVVTDQARLMHTHITGPTGTGKTVLIEQLLFHDLVRGYGAIIIDPKGDRDFYNRIKAFTKSIGRASDLHLLSATHIEESARWNPCRLGSASQLQSKFLNSATYDNPHYAKACELALRKAFDSLTDGHKKAFTLLDLVSELERIAKSSGDQTIQGLYFDLYNLALSDWAPIFGTDDCLDGKPEITLLDVVRKNEILFIDLPTEAMTIQSQRIGRLLLQEVMLLSGMRKMFPFIRSGIPFSVFIDEFDAFATQPFATFLNKGRSSGFMIHMAHQTLSDLKLVSDTFTGQIMGNTNVRFIFRQDDPCDADHWSKFFGTSLKIKSTFQTKDGSQTGMSSNREVQEFRIAPDMIKDLSIGECIFSVKTEKKLQKLKIPGPDAFGLPKISLPTIWGEIPAPTHQKRSLKSDLSQYDKIRENIKPKKETEVNQ